MNRAVIVGVTSHGRAIALQLNQLLEYRIDVVGFIIDTSSNEVKSDELSLLGDVHHIADIVIDNDIDIVIIAISSSSAFRTEDIVKACVPTRAKVCVAQDVVDILDSRLELVKLRPELVLKSVVGDTSTPRVTEYLQNASVMIAGAGGSIGSELAQQVAALRPKHLVLLGRGENSIFELQQKLQRSYGLSITPVICDISDRSSLRRAMLQERPDVIYHAAAHKHVPLMESYPHEALKNNVMGTLNVIELAIEYCVNRVVYISTDKAVNPISVMGATKRITELMIQSLGRTPQTRFSIVRFGNVLGSRGSVVHLMLKQIENGGPITITDQRMMRYFMSIPDAAWLVMEAGVLGAKGEIYVLELGRPMLITELAVTLIRLSGLRPYVDIDIVYTGARPGERIEEQLHSQDEELVRTHNDSIFSIAHNLVAPLCWWDKLHHLIKTCDQYDLGTMRNEILQLATTGDGYQFSFG